MIQLLVTDFSTDYSYPYNRMPQTIPSSTPTQLISNSTLLPFQESRTSEEPEDMELDSSDEDSLFSSNVETASSMTATTSTHITCPSSTGSSGPRGISGSHTKDSGKDKDLGMGSLSPAPPLHPSLTHPFHFIAFTVRLNNCGCPAEPRGLRSYNLCRFPKSGTSAGDELSCGGPWV